MLFNSLEFIFLFLPVTLIVYAIICRVRSELAAGWLIMASVFFYGWWDWHYVYLLLASIIMNFFFGLAILKANAEAHRSFSRVLLIAACVLNIGALAYFKYAMFITANIRYLTHIDFTFGNIILPLGISFFTFTQLAYLMDTYRDNHQHYSFGHYCLFVTYFPHLIAGPIIHHSEMMPQFQNPKSYSFRFSQLVAGLTLFSFGLFKKVIFADSMGGLATPFFDWVARGGVPGMIDGWFGALAYTLQLYYDFSGYSDMAVGLSFMFGFKLPINFDSPYKASSIIEFWRRWHITLSRFLRSYVYIQLGGNRKGATRRCVNLLVTMLIGGVWHGAGWTFIVWGGMHGVFLVVNSLWRSVVRRNDASPKTNFLSTLWRRALTFVCVVLAWVVFRASDMTSAWVLVSSMFSVNRIHGMQGSFDDVYSIGIVLLLLMITFIAPNTMQIMRRISLALAESYRPRREFSWPELSWSTSGSWAVITSVILAVSVLHIIMSETLSEFLYFQF